MIPGVSTKTVQEISEETCRVLTDYVSIPKLVFNVICNDSEVYSGRERVSHKSVFTTVKESTSNTTSLNSKNTLGNLINDTSKSIESSRSQQYGSEPINEKNGYDVTKARQPRLGFHLRRSGHVVGPSSPNSRSPTPSSSPARQTKGLADPLGDIAVAISLGSDHEGGGAGEASQDERSRSPPSGAHKWQQRSGGGSSSSVAQNGTVLGANVNNSRVEKSTGLSSYGGGEEVYLGVEVPVDSEKSWIENRNKVTCGGGVKIDSYLNNINSSNDSGSYRSGGNNNITNYGKSLLSKRKKYSPRRITIHPASESPGASESSNTLKGGGSPRYLREKGEGGGGAQRDSPSPNSITRDDSSVVHCKIECKGTVEESNPSTFSRPNNINESDDYINQGDDSSEYSTIKVERNIEGHFVIKETTNHYYSTGSNNNSGEKSNISSLENGRKNKNKSHNSSQNQSLSWVEIQQQSHLAEHQNQQQPNQQQQQNHHRPGSGLKIHHIVKNGREIYPPGLDSRSATPCYIRDQQSPIWVTRASRTGALADDEENAQDSEWAERVSLSDASEYQYPESGRQSPRTGPDSVRAGHGKPNKANTRPRRIGMSRRGRRGCCKILRLKEDNARFILLAIVMVFYMLTGAAIFSAIERDNEIEEKEVYRQHIDSFKTKYPFVNETDLNVLLRIHSDAETAGYVGDKRSRWDYSGSFYFVGTVVSTIGFGMTTPRTPAGKVILVFYGFFGCAGAILFFNLFLERIITFLAYILRAIHDRGQRKQGLAGRRRSSQGSDDEQLDSWKPSVYWVMLILLLGAISVALVASGMYHPVEDWTFWDAMYFCFVAFATIGFGDYVVSQKDDYPNVVLYRLGNFVFIVLGCCCVYSLFNVTSIVIKQFLNWMLRKLNCECRLRRPQVTRRNAITPGHIQRGKAKAAAAAASGGLGRGAAASTSAEPVNKAAPMVTVTDADGDSDSEYRRNSGEMISMKDFLQANKISLAMMQKQLWETSQRSFNHNNNSGFQGGVGPLAILNRKLGQDEFDPSM